MLESFFRQVSYTWRNSDFFNNIGFWQPFAWFIVVDALITTSGQA
jgi:hypothetical protein